MSKVPKNKRQCNYKASSKTLDLRHKTQMEEFGDLHHKVQEYRAELDGLNDKLDLIKSKSKHELDDGEFLDMVDLSDRIADLHNKIEGINDNHDEIEYFTKTGNVLFEYYSLLSNSNLTQSNQCAQKKNKVVESTNKRRVVDFFKQKSPSSAASIECDNSENISINENNRAELLEKYLSHTDDNYIDNSVVNKDALTCSFCGNDDLKFYPNESIHCCDTCFTVTKVITEREKPSYKDPPKEISYFSYKRINHYTEWLNQIQGKETTDIPEHVFEAILNEFKKQRVTDLKTITRQKVKEILKKLKINKYYEHIPFILNRLTGNPNPHLSPQLENKLKEMFALIQVPFLKHAPLIRKNFLSYSYVLHKFIQLLGQTEYLQFFPLLKSREKLMQQEIIWRKICEELNWEFIRSI